MTSTELLTTWRADQTAWASLGMTELGTVLVGPPDPEEYA